MLIGKDPEKTKTGALFLSALISPLYMYNLIGHANLSSLQKPDVAVTDMELQLKEEQALRQDYEAKLSAMVRDF